jgi:hypothetical protein
VRGNPDATLDRHAHATYSVRNGHATEDRAGRASHGLPKLHAWQCCAIKEPRLKRHTCRDLACFAMLLRQSLSTGVLCPAKKKSRCRRERAVLASMVGWLAAQKSHSPAARIGRAGPAPSPKIRRPHFVESAFSQHRCRPHRMAGVPGVGTGSPFSGSRCSYLIGLETERGFRGEAEHVYDPETSLDGSLFLTIAASGCRQRGSTLCKARTIRPRPPRTGLGGTGLARRGKSRPPPAWRYESGFTWIMGLLSCDPDSTRPARARIRRWEDRLAGVGGRWIL